MAPGIPGFAKEVVWTVDWHGDIGTCSSCWRNFYSRMAFLRQPTLWDGVFLTRHHLSSKLETPSLRHWKFRTRISGRACLFSCRTTKSPVYNSWRITDGNAPHRCSTCVRNEHATGEHLAAEIQNGRQFTLEGHSLEHGNEGRIRTREGRFFEDRRHARAAHIRSAAPRLHRGERGRCGGWCRDCCRHDVRLYAGKVIDFKADHPFIFFIRDNVNESILFLGRFATP